MLNRMAKNIPAIMTIAYMPMPKYIAAAWSAFATLESENSPILPARRSGLLTDLHDAVDGKDLLTSGFSHTVAK